jgi:hypothetical protein
MRIPKLTTSESDAVERSDCRICGKTAKDAGGRNGCVYDPATGEFYAQCTGCWNAAVRARDTAAKAARAAAPRCEGCGRGQQSVIVCPGTVAEAKLCRGCAGRVRARTAQPMLFGSGFGHLTKADVLAATRRR